MNVSVGAATTVLTSNGVGVAPSYAAPAGGEFTAAWTADHNQGGSAFGLRDALFVDPTVTTKKLQIDLVGMTAAVTAILDFNFTTAKTITFPDATDTLVGKATTDVFTNKSYALGGAGNALTGTRAEFDTACTNDDFAYLGQANIFGDFNQRFRNSKLRMANPADTFVYILATSAIIANRTITLPLLTGNDTMTLNAFAATLTNKTIDADNNTITNIGSTEVKSELITGLTQVTPLGADEIMITDASDAGNLKRALISALPGGGGSSFADNAFDIHDEVNTTARVIFNLDGASAGFDTTLDFNGTAARTLTFPNVTDTLAVKGANTFTADQNLGTNDIVNAGKLAVNQTAVDANNEVVVTLASADANGMLLQDATAGHIRLHNDHSTPATNFTGVIEGLASAGGEGLHVIGEIPVANDTGTTPPALLLDGQREGGGIITNRDVISLANRGTPSLTLTATLGWDFETSAVTNMSRLAIGQATIDSSNELVIELESDAANGVLLQDGTEGHIRFYNDDTTPITEFSPVIEGEGSNSATRNGLILRGKVPVAADTGTTPVVLIQTQQDDETPITSRDLFSINNGSAEFTILNNGNISTEGNALQFNAADESISIQTGDMIFDVPTTDFFSFDIAGAPEYTMNATTLDLLGNNIDNFNQIQANALTNAIVFSPGDTHERIQSSADDELNFITGLTLRLTISGTTITSTLDLDMSGNDINLGAAGTIFFSATDTAISEQVGSMFFDVPTTESFSFDIAGVPEYTFSATLADFNGNTLTNILDITSITSLNGVAIGVYALETDNLSVFAPTTSLQLAGVISDETGSGLLVFGTSPVLITPDLGTPTNLVLTSATGLVNAGIAAGAGIDLSKIDPITFTDTIPCVLEVAQGTVAYPDIHSLVTQVSKVSGWVMPTATDSTLNFKFICPEDLASTPGLIIRVHTVTLSANTTDAVNLTLNMRYTGDTENTDQAFNQTVAATNYNVSDTIESYDTHDITPTNSPTAGELVTGQIFRDVSLDVAGDVLIVGISALIDRTIT